MNRALMMIAALCLAASWALARQPKDDLPALRAAHLAVPNPTPPRAAAYLGGTPGKNARLTRSYDTAPPMIPHAVEDYLPITTRNECLNCHLNPPRIVVQMGISPLPSSHFKDRDGKDRAGPLPSVADIYQGFYNCSMCHAPQADTPPLVGNTFRGR